MTVDARDAPDIAWVAQIGAVAAGNAIAAETAISARARRAAAKRRALAAPMMNFVSRLFGRGEPAFSEARPSDAAAIAAMHGASFQRGWGEDEIHRLLVERNVVAHRATSGRKLIGFILSRLAAGEAEILSVAIAPAWRGRGAGAAAARSASAPAGRPRRPLGVSRSRRATMRRPAALYRRAGFREVGRRQGYYQSGATALVLRRDLG